MTRLDILMLIPRGNLWGNDRSRREEDGRLGREKGKRHRWTLFSVMTVSRNPIFRVGHDCSRDIRPHGSNWRFSVMTVFLVCHDLPFVWL